MLDTRISRSLSMGAAALLLAPTVWAQSFNIDVNAAAGGPTNAYGAAAGQAGKWNSFAPAVPPSALMPLVGLNGAATGVTMQVTPGPNGWFPAVAGAPAWNHNNPNTTGDDQALMDDIKDVGGGVPNKASGIYVTIKGLAANTYDVYTYCWAPDNYLPGNGGYPWITQVKVPGSPTGQTPVGALDWPVSGHVLGETYAKHTLTLAAGADLVILVESDAAGVNAGSFASLNGIQIVEGGSSVNTFCTSKPSSIPGCVPALTAPSASFSKTGGPGSYTISAVPVPGGNGKPGILIYTKNGLLATPPNTPFGFLCLNQFLRAGAFPAQPGGTLGTCNGAYNWDFGAMAASLNFAAGDTLHIQAWYRDPTNPGTANFTQGIGPITVTP